MLGEENILFLLVFVIGGIIFGALIMYLIMDARRDKSAGKESPTQPFSISEDEDKDLSSEPDSLVEPISQAEQVINRKKILSFWKEPQSGKLLVHIDENWFENTSQMTPGERVLFERILREGALWLDMVLSKAKMAVKEDPVPQPPLQSTPISIQTEAPARKKSIVEQIDDILQELIVKTPLKDQKIRLSEMYNKGVVVWIGQNYYEGIDGVPDEQVKSLIKMAVKKWEADNSSR